MIIFVIGQKNVGGENRPKLSQIGKLHNIIVNTIEMSFHKTCAEGNPKIDQKTKI